MDSEERGIQREASSEERAKDDACTRARQEVLRLRDALREAVRISASSPREIEEQLGMSERSIPKALAVPRRLRVDTTYRILHGLGEDPGSFFHRVYDTPPTAKGFLANRARNHTQSWPDHRILIRVARSIGKAPSSPAGSPPFAGEELTEQIHRLSSQRRHYRRLRMRNTLSLQHPAFGLPFCEHLDELRYDAPSEAASIAMDVIEKMVPRLRGMLDERLPVLVSALGVLGSALSQQRYFGRAAFALHLALEICMGHELKSWVGRTLQRTAYLAVNLREDEWAQSILFNSMSAYKSIGDSGAVARIMIDLAYVALSSNEYKCAIFDLHLALSLIEIGKKENKRHITAAYQYLSFAHRGLGQSEEALEALKLAAEHATEGPRLNLAKILAAKGELLSSMNRYGEAAAHFSDAADIFELCEAWSLQASAIVDRSYMLLKMKKSEEAAQESSRLMVLLMKLDSDAPAAKAALLAIEGLRSTKPNEAAIREAISVFKNDRAPGSRTHDRVTSY